MTGGGFGGCTVSLVRKEHLARLAALLTRIISGPRGSSLPLHFAAGDGGADRHPLPPPAHYRDSSSPMTARPANVRIGATTR